MLEQDVKPDEIIFNNVLTACCTFPMRSDNVIRIFETLIGHGMRPTTTTLSILIKALMNTDAWSRSLQVLKDAPQSFKLEPEGRLYAQLAQACAKARKPKAVLEIFSVMLQAQERQRK